MRPLQSTVSLVIALFSASVIAGSAVSKDKVKTGILPSGDLYSIYEVSCADDSKTQIAVLDRRHNWCVMDGIDLDCFRMPEQAADQACAAGQLEVAGDPKTTADDMLPDQGRSSTDT